MSKTDKTTDKKKLVDWQEKYEKAKSAYGDTLGSIVEYFKLYKGTRNITGKDGGMAKDAATVRNIISENIDSQTDSTIPSPKVTARREADEGLAQLIENWERNEIDRLPFEALNDLDERVTPIAGSDFFLIEWDNSKGTHSTVGSLAVTRMNPKQVIPQPGVNEIQDMDYIFITLSKTKDAIKRRYKVNVEDESDTEGSDKEDILTQIVVYFKDDTGVIGRFSWVGETILEDYSDYYARRLSRCKKCGQPGAGECKFCGSKSFETTIEKDETLLEDIVKPDGSIISATAPAYNPLTGMMAMESVKIPYYKPDKYPVVMRRNISLPDDFIGDSDVFRIKDQQNNIKIAETKIKEKLTAGGSYAILPDGVKIDTSNNEMKVFRVKTPAEKAMIDAITLQGDIDKDMAYIQANYEAARQTIGITDSFQGRQDRTATSGKAKEFAAAQAAGRLESKRVMKGAAYADIFEMMFKLQLSFSDQPVTVVSKDALGKNEYGEFNRYDFLEMDDAGELYWNDSFLFSVDSSAPLANNREAMWQETRMNLQQGAFGDPTSLETLVLFWTKMELLHYPGASGTKQYIQGQLEKQQAMMQMQQQIPPPAGMGAPPMEPMPTMEQPPMMPQQSPMMGGI